ncbi:MAG: DEAD/DEAH box helicase [Calditrichaeota bacterium]|nr:MAG: DEAD/DEAH box helicase [Calditrichota bacterium]
MSFTQFNLHVRLHSGIEKAGYTHPTPVQTEAIPLILDGHDMIGTAQTGTGKTAAFVLPILHRLIAGTRGKTRAMIITPTRELAEQIHEAIRLLGIHTTVRSATIYGGVASKPQIRALNSGVEILVVCPGRLLDLHDQGYGDLSGVETVVLDEADRMLDMGFFPSVRKILKKLPKKRQTLLFSATFPPEVEQLAAETLHDPRRVSLSLRKPIHTVSHALYPVAPQRKTKLLLELLQQMEANSVLIFTRTKHRAQKLAQQIGRTGYKVTSLHSDRSQSQRQSALKGFKDGLYQIMVATDIAARGLDVERISHVINFDMPASPDDYIHRIGRTGRAERAGDAFTLATPEDAAMVRTLEKIIGNPIPRHQLSNFNYLLEEDESAKNDRTPRSGSFAMKHGDHFRKNSVPRRQFHSAPKKRQ